jgi:hypothetical protein
MNYPSIYFAGQAQMPAKPVHPAGARRAAVLLIVLVILTIFAAIGLAFMFYAESESQVSQGFRESISVPVPDVDPDLAFSMFLQQLIFDCVDDESGVYSALRGHSLLRNMYGMNYTIAQASGSAALNGNTVPFNGMGRLHWQFAQPVTPPAVPSGYPIGMTKDLYGQDDYGLINYTYFPQKRAAVNFLRDPERFGARAGLRAANAADNRALYIGGANPGYSAPDFNFLALAAVQNDGTILQPSFHRSYGSFGTLAPQNAKWYAADTTDAAGNVTSQNLFKYQVLRPRPADHPAVTVNGVNKAGFPATESAGGDVRNRPPSWGPSDPNYNDSIWLYTGAPVWTLPDGRQYTMLVAPLIVDLEGKINLSTAGNIRGTQQIGTKTYPAHGSNTGMAGPAEINLGTILPQTVNGIPEWINLFNGANAPTTIAPLRMPGKYGTNGSGGPGYAGGSKTGTAVAPAALGGTPPAGPHFYAKIDFDGVTGWSLTVGGTPTGKWAAATSPGTTQKPYVMWPLYPAGYENGSTLERTQHPLLYDPVTQQPGNRIFTAAELEKLYRWGDTGTDALFSDLWSLIPTNLSSGSTAVNVRNMLTTYSFDRREASLMPWLYNPKAFSAKSIIPPHTYALPYAPPAFTPVAGPGVASGTALPSPPINEYLRTTTAPIVRAFPARHPKGSLEMSRYLRGQPDSSNASVMQYPVRIDLNKPYLAAGATARSTLPEYPTLASGAQRYGQATATVSATNPVGLTLTGADLAAYKTAVQARQQFALDLFNVLRAVTGATDPTNAVYTVGQYGANTAAGVAMTQQVDALRYLAQLAVNIVDFVDDDDYVTPFCWLMPFMPVAQGGQDSTGNYSNFLTDLQGQQHSWVFGTEIPKVLINEVYAQYKSPANPLTNALGSYVNHYTVDLWAELFNPMQTDTTLNESGNSRLYVSAVTGTTPLPGYPAYEMMVATPKAGAAAIFNMHDPKNTTGKPNATIHGTVAADWATATTAGVDSTIIKPLPANAFGSPAPFDRGGNTGFYMVGPKTKGAAPAPVLFPSKGAGAGAARVPVATINSQAMQYNFNIPGNGTANGTGTPPPPTLVLQRLLCPYAPPDLAMTDSNGNLNPTYNPYITVDYFDCNLQNYPNYIKDSGNVPNPPNTQPNFNGMNSQATWSGVPKMVALTPNPITQCQSIGRIQPFQAFQTYKPPTVAALAPAVQAQAVIFEKRTGAVLTPDQPQNTFFQHNTPTPTIVANAYPNGYAMTWPATKPAAGAYQSFNWLVHLDRQLISPMELLNVSGYRPHELTQQFTGYWPTPTVANTSGAWMGGHQAPWFDNAALLYRFFEFAQTTPRQQNIDSTTTRYPGKININTIFPVPNTPTPGAWDPTMFSAICDPQPSNYFTSGDVGQIWTKLIQSRHPGDSTVTPNIPAGQMSNMDRYFKPFSAGFITSGDTQFNTWGLGIEDTLLRPATTSAVTSSSFTASNTRLLEPQAQAADPYQRFELLNKIYNNFTTRSNSFAVWATVGFFEVNQVVAVKDAAGKLVGNRIYLGQEINRDQGRNIRHKMFAIIDRSQLDMTAQSDLPATAKVDWTTVWQNILNQQQSPLSTQGTNTLAPNVPAVPPPVFNPRSPVFQPVVPYYTLIE